MNDAMRVVEMFYSVQGEGQYVGMPSVFLRLSGCNFRCQGYGMPVGQLSNAYREIDPRQYQSLTELPVVKTGCDSYPSWDPRCQHLTQKVPVDELANALLALTPERNWRTTTQQAIHLVITGGEPLLGWQDQIAVLLAQPSMCSLRYLSFETNGTQILNLGLQDHFNKQSQLDEVLFTVSPKLPNSGEAWGEAIRPEVLAQYARVKNASMVLKFVVQSERCFDDICKAVDAYQEAGVICRVYCMPAGADEISINKIAATIATLALRHGFAYSPRLHVDLWNNAWAT